MEGGSATSGTDDRASGNQALLRIELGGGKFARDGFTNIDIDGGDIVHDLNLSLPLATDSVSEVYSSHCLEHISNIWGLINEICRVCQVGAKVTLIVPHYGQEMAMCPGHHHVISEQMIDHFGEFPRVFTGRKRLELKKKIHRPTKHFFEAKRLFPKFTDLQLYRFVPNTCHDVTFVLEVME